MEKCTGKFNGLGVAIVTPFRDGKVDYKALKLLIDFLIKGGVDFLVPCGTTGESPTLDYNEHVVIIKMTVNETKGRIPVLAGTGANCTGEAVALTEAAKHAGADGALVVSPYYNKPMSAGFLDYYRQIAEVGLPVILYDIPGRTAKGVPTDVILKLAHEGAIKGIKWASGDFNQLMQIIHNTPVEFSVLSGDDSFTLPLMALGGHGVISVVGNIIPKDMSKFISALRQGDIKFGKEEHYRLLKLMQAMFLETNPIPVKTALSFMYPKVFAEEFRSPMTQMEQSPRNMLIDVLRKYELLPDQQ